ncbi:hypothetical protein C2845_PM17G12150 [Panicum miliaceum]|uniref:FBD domain-containing protein n=1 Tax=Panicum miliaceum TaxID=4540 RepID=A0A3L6Q1G1_PANMI|nr:hypothetical protein C2845_PM17G12150 [Panicum miliaceum]
MDGGEVTALVCTRCPRLRNLRLCLVLVGDHGVSIRSDSLRSLSFNVARARRLEVVTPGLEYLYVGEDIGEARVSAPKLAGLVWSCHATYDPHRHRFEEDAGRHRLQLLDIGETSAAGLLMQKFDGVDQLRLGVSIPQWFCPCLLVENRRIDGIDLSSLEEVEITSYTTSSQKELLEFVEQLCRCNAPILGKLVFSHTMFSAPSQAKVVFEKIRSMCYPKIEVEFNDFVDGAWIVWR